MKKIITVLVLLFCCLVISAEAESTDLTLLQILANPSAHHLKRVRVIGYLHLKAYDDALYLHEEDYRHALYGNSIWVDATDDMRNHEKKLNDRYVIIEGIFDAENHGTMGAHTGTIKKIQRCEVWSTQTLPANPRPDIVSTSGDE